MKRLLVLLSVVILMVTSISCTKSGTPSGEVNTMIEPGDKIGDFLITTGVEGNFTYGFNVQCSEPGEKNTYSCNAVVGEAINVSTGLFDDTGSENLDQIWAKSNYQVFINDRPVDLQAFGTIDYNHPDVGVIRFANVVITASQPGEITVRDAGVFDTGEPFESISTYVFSVP